MSEERSPKEVSGLLQLACAIHAMDPRTRHLLLDAARLLDDYAALLARVARLEEALGRIAYADMWTLTKDGSDAGEHFQEVATRALEEK